MNVFLFSIPGKPLYILIVIAGLALSGCSSIYNVNSFPSKVEFYNEFNSMAGNKQIQVTLKNEKKIIVNEGSVIENDTLYNLSELTTETQNVIPLSMVKEIFRSWYNYQRGDIYLTNNKSIPAVNIHTAHDSLFFTTINNEELKTGIAPISEVRSAKYKNRWLAIPLGLAAGILAGGVLGLLIPDYPEMQPDMTTRSQNIGHNSYTGFLFGATYGAVIGSIIGWIVGYNYVYRF